MCCGTFSKDIYFCFSDGTWVFVFLIHFSSNADSHIWGLLLVMFIVLILCFYLVYPLLSVITLYLIQVSLACLLRYYMKLEYWMNTYCVYHFSSSVSCCIIAETSVLLTWFSNDILGLFIKEKIWNKT